jgi:Periplasmic binding protein-like domain
MGYALGKDVAIIVIVDTALCLYYSPALTGFRPDLELLGRRLGEMLLASLPDYAGPGGVHVITRFGRSSLCRATAGERRTLAIREYVVFKDREVSYRSSGQSLGRFEMIQVCGGPTMA